MDMSIISCLTAIFLPLFYALYLFISRISLSYINKKILNTGSIAINILSLFIFTVQTALIIKENSSINIDLFLFNIRKINLNAGIIINAENILFLLFSSFIFTLIAIYSKLYFDKNKKFLFTKQRFYIFLSALSFCIYMFFASSNLFQMFLFLCLTAMVIFIYSYFDVYKTTVNFNITRFQRIHTLGDFSVLISILILFKYAILSEGYINSTSLNFNELDVLASYTYGISTPIEFKIITAGFIIAFMSRLFIFPFGCYCSFMANSSNLLYLSSVTVANSLIGIYIFFRAIPFIELYYNLQDYLIIIFIFSGIVSLAATLFEKNLKIIFGHFISILNVFFLTLYLFSKQNSIFIIYLIFNFITLFVLMYLFIKDKSSLNKAIISKYKGYFLEKMHIILFEKIPNKISDITNIINENIVQNIIIIPIKILNATASFMILKITKKDSTKIIRIILFIFVLFTLLAIFIALFGRYKC